MAGRTTAKDTQPHDSHQGETAMARGEVMLRQWNLLKMLQTRGEGTPLRDLADAFDVTERTIQRDFETLQEMGFPLEYDADEYGKRYWRLPVDFARAGSLVLSLTEAISLHLAEQLLHPLTNTLFADGLDSVLQKIRSLVPQTALDHFAELDTTLYVRRLGETDYSAHADTIRVLADAARRDLSVDVTYRALWRRDEYETRFDPYGLVLYDADLFLVGRSHRAGETRVFKVARIADAVLTTESFDRPDDFSLEEHFTASFGIVQTNREPVEVVARFTGTAAMLVEERNWHETQTLAWLDAEATLFDEAPDEPEALLATFRLANLVEFKRWIKGFGDQAEVIRPESLRHELRSELLSAALLYGD
jgi:proteasome accessory factor B